MKKTNLLILVNDIVLIGSALIAIIITLLDFLGVLDKVPWLLSHVSILTLLSLSFLLISVVIERRTSLEKIQRTLENIISNYTFGAQYLDNAQAVITQLERVILRSNETVMAIGAQSRARSYLNAIRASVCERHVIYYRLIDRNHIYHELHEHLLEIIKLPNVQVGWTPREKYGNFLVTEIESIIAFPAPYEDRFTALWLPGQQNSRRYTQNFLESFSKSLPLRTEKALEVLCIKCSPQTAGNTKEVETLLQQELRSSLDESIRIKGDLF